MKSAALFIIFLSSVLSVCAQSGRNKPGEKPTPTPLPPRVVYSPSGTDPEKVKPTPSPAPSRTRVVEEKDDGEVIRVESALVPIPATVTDARGRAVTNLRIEDFLLEIEGRQVEIGELTRSQLPVRLALLFDNSSSVLEAREFEKRAAVRFFRQVIRPEKDLAALFTVSTVSRLEQPLTSNVSLLVQAIEFFPKPEGATALLDGIIEAADYLRFAEGRRVIVIVSDGEDTYSDLETTLEKTVRAVQRANCQVYVVKTTEFENFKKTGLRGGNANIRSLTAERRMQEISTQTGGTVYSPIDEDELNEAFSRISAELSDQYILSYYPEENAAPGAFRNITLRVKSRKDLTVRTRKGYFVAKR
jgi:VWFA-related protein